MPGPCEPDVKLEQNFRFLIECYELRTTHQQEGSEVKNGKCNALVTAIVGVVFSGCAAKAVNTTEWGDLKADPVADEISRKARKILDL